jgi:hypothetical protein
MVLRERSPELDESVGRVIEDAEQQVAFGGRRGEDPDLAWKPRSTRWASVRSASRPIRRSKSTIVLQSSSLTGIPAIRSTS